MKRVVVPLLALALAGPAAAAWAAPMTPAVQDRLDTYRRQGAGEFSIDWAREHWTKPVVSPEDGKERSCTSCHGSDLTRGGEHKKTGKPIDPMAYSVNPERYTDVKKIEKWFKRNCDWAWGRECTPQEKGSFLLFLLNQ